MAIDMSRLQRSVLDDAIRKARIVQQNGTREDAAAAWEVAAKHADAFATMAGTEAEHVRRFATARELRAIASRLRSVIQTEQPQPGRKPVVESGKSADEFREAVARLIHRSSIRFDDIAGLQETSAEIQAAFALSLAKAPEGVQVPRMQNLLFYGPPGCGKTLLAAAISNELDATFFSVKVSDLLSKYFGDSPKLVEALYDEARSRGNSVVFLDEFDALASSRSDGDSSADRKLLVSLLTELDGLKQKDGGSQVLTIAATNRPWDLDEAILSRYEKAVYIPLPDEPARLRMLQLHLQEKGYQSEIDDAILLQQTEGLSGREIAHLCKLMIGAMMKDANPTILNVAAEGREAIRSYTVQVRPIQELHLRTVRPRIQPRSTKESIELFRLWGRDGNS